MTPIDINKANIIEAKKNHINEITPLILEKVNKLFEKENKKFQQRLPNQKDSLEKLKLILDDASIRSIIGYSPKKLYQINLWFFKKYIDNFKLEDWEDYIQIDKIKNFNSREQFLKRIFDEIFNLLADIFNFTAFSNKKVSKYDAYNLADKLDIPTCPYCGRIYTKTVGRKNGKKITRPTFDHWFPQSKFPLLALSFYNLIPSCNICNSSVKGTGLFSLKTHFHPYHQVDDFKYTFSYDLKLYQKPKVKIGAAKGISLNTAMAFELEAIYNTHEDEVADLLKIRQAYSENYIDILNNTLKGVNLTREEVYRLAFGVHFEEDKFDRRPLSKMKKDILTELGIINPQ